MDKSNILKKLWIPLIVVVAILAVTGLYRRNHISGSTLVNGYSRPGGDTLAVAIEMSPLTYNFSTDTASGFDYEMLSDIFKQHGIAARFYPVGALESAFEGLYDGRYDMLVASMPKTSTLKRYFPLTDDVYLDGQVVVQPDDSTSNHYISGAQQLVGDTVWLPEGSPYLTRLRNLSKELGDSIYIATREGYSSEILAIMTALGKIPKAVVGEAVARRIAQRYPSLDIKTPVSLTQLQCWAVAPGDSVLLDSLNRWINEYKDTPRYAALADRYLN